MSDIKNEIKKIIGLAKTDFRAELAFGGEIVLSKADLCSLITTIESQKEEIERLKIAVHIDVSLGNTVSEMHTEIESLKAITELAVKGLKDISSMRSYKVDWEGYTDYEKLCGVEDVANNTLSEIERISHG